MLGTIVIDYHAQIPDWVAGGFIGVLALLVVLLFVSLWVARS